MMQELYVDNTILQGIHESFLYQNFNAFCFETLFFCDYTYVCMIYMYE